MLGKVGLILVCNGNDWPSFSVCLNLKVGHSFGAQNTPSSNEISMVRTTYNPDFANVFAEFEKVFLVLAERIAKHSYVCGENQPCRDIVINRDIVIKSGKYTVCYLH